ncbi:hydrocephalus-inducing protein homolog isoform X3 [Physella acuta]|uniref:hydrocephalus-inducing protein homolog isoform X3 n=1 Tax=Physella acuta TaxID=109671 RepID=UPI0027DD3531|nr:hydrocephalus-inducing protein homolog isoform X3 [Physella acuta]
MVRPNTVFKVIPSEGEIPPEKSAEITVIANLDDCVRFQEKLQINFQQSQCRVIPLQAHGKGTTIVSDPPLGTLLDLGPNFSNNKLIRKFKLTNQGRRIQQLVWLTNGFIPLSKAKRDRIRVDVKKSTHRANEPAEPVFQLSPNRMELLPGESTELTIEGFVDGPRTVAETIMCHAIIGRSGGKIPIINVDVKAEFIEPLLSFSTKCVFFRVDKAPTDELQTQQKQIVLTNVSSLPLTIKLKLAYPFSIIICNENIYKLEACLQSGEDYKLVIQFDPQFKDDSHIRSIDEVLYVSYKEHPHVDYISLRGEVYFPNLLFEKNTVDFGCILNDTEVTRYINITNNSPMEVCYRWSFLVGDGNTEIKKFIRPREDSGVDNAGVNDEEDSGLEEDEEDELRQHEEASGPEEDHVEDVIDPMNPEPTDKITLTKKTPNSDDNKNDEVDLQPISPVDEDAPEKGQLDQEEKKEKSKRSGKSSVLAQLALKKEEEEALMANRVLTALLETEEDIAPVIGVEEVFDILPLYGCLQPGDTEQVTFTFYGHTDIWGKVKAICEVNGGPTYELTLTGEASLLEYTFDTQAIDLGKQMYDHVGSSSITLVNTGKVGFKFSGINMDPALQKRPLPGQPIIIPHSGYVEPFCKQEIQIKYLPGVPEIFEKTFQIQVAHFEPDTITLRGEGVFPRISLDLPRLEDDDGLYNSLLQEAKYNLTNLLKQQQEQQKKVQADNSDEEEELVKLMSADESGVEMKDSARGDKSGNNSGDHVREPTELEILMEVERLAVRDYARENQSFTKLLLASVDEAGESLPQVDSTATLCASELFSSKIKPTLPEYLLDFGYVVLGAMRTHVVRVTNTGWMPVSFKLERENIHQLGFHIELDRVRNLPGAPDNETLDFVVSFDPRGANLHLGFVETVVPINIAHGPVVNMRLRAHVTMPDLEVSQDVLEFDEVKCGECKVITIQLYNHQMVKCEWNSVPPDESKKIDKHVPMHLRRKMKQNKKKSHIFEVLPPTGVLMPGQRINVQVKFMPTEEKFYENRIPIRIAQSSQRILLLCHGQGLEPRLEFDRSVVKFGPILPHSPGDDQEILVKNPCPFPIEFYSLEFDTNYLEEEKILRLMRGYDEFNTLLLPPRPVGSKLPPELIEYYEDQLRKLEEEEKARELEAIEAKKRAEEEAEAAEKEAESVDENQNEAAVRDVTPAEPVLQPSKQGVNSELAIAASKERKDDLLNDKLKASSTGMMGVGELEITPVSAAIARYLGIDLTPEGKAARNRRGIAIIVHGAPVSGKTSTAISLAKHYEAALLTIDGIVCDAIANGNTPAGQRARELCMEAAKRKSEEIRELEQVEMEKKIGLSVEQVTAHTQGAAGAAGTSMGSNRKTSTIMEQKNKEKQSTLSKNTGVNSSIEGATSPLPVVAPVARKLSISASVAGEEGLVSCVLPDELLVEILAERLQLNDCHRGVVFDGLDTLFSLNYFMTASAILKALNNRRFIYFVTLKLDYNVLKEQEKRAQEEKVLEEQLKEEKELLWLEEMDEEEYDALPEDIKARIDLKRLNLKKERIKKEQQEKAERERIEREAREEEERKKEEENRSKKGKGKKGTAPAPDKKTPAGGKVASKAQFSKAQEADKGTGSDRPESHLTEKSDNLAEDHKKKKGKGKKEGTELSSSAEEVKDLAKEAELLLMSRFRTFETYQKDIQDLLEFWDRTSLLPRRPNTPSDKSDEDHKETSLSARKGKSKASLFTKDDEKLDKEKLKEVERIRMERELAEKVAKESAQAEEQKEVVEEEKKDEVGVPHIIVDCGERIVMLYQRILDTLPSTTDISGRIKAGKRLASTSKNINQSFRPRYSTLEDWPMEFRKAKIIAGCPFGARNTRITTSDTYLTVVRNLIFKNRSQNNSNTKSPSLDSRIKFLKEVEMYLSGDAEGTPQPTLSHENLLFDGMLLESGHLPTKEEVLDGLGLGTQGPPIPPPATFAVIPFPVKRKPPPLPEMGGGYTFIAAYPDDPNVGIEEKSKEEVEEEAAVVEKLSKEENAKKGGKGADKGRTSTEQKRSAERKKNRRNSVAQAASPTSEGGIPADDPAQQGAQPTAENLIPPKPLTIFRWTVQANGEVKLKLRFLSDDLGQFDQTMNFEIVGTRRRYQLFCRGVCAFPTISKEPRIVFQSRKKNRRLDEIVHKKYILNTETFEFGPLLVGKSRDKYREGKYPENMETITILNTSPLDSEVSFCFLHDSKGDTYLLEPPNMLLKPGESSTLTIWAYPKVKEGELEEVEVVRRSLGLEVETDKQEPEEPEAKPQVVASLTKRRSTMAHPSSSLLKDAKTPSIDIVAKATPSNEEETHLKIGENPVEMKSDVEKIIEAVMTPQSAGSSKNKSFPFAQRQDKHKIRAKPSPGHYEDAIVCCIKENPEPVVFKVCCDGYRPELELDKKMLHFDKVLLHRKDTKTIYLRNSTQLPVAWKLSGLENLGDDFTVAADSGIVEPLSEYPLHAYFRAMKAVSTNRKMIRIEISDADNIMGVVHTEPIQVIAEAYDVALDMSFPKGIVHEKKGKKGRSPSMILPDETKTKHKPPSISKDMPPTFSLMGGRGTDGGLDFGTLRINEEGRQSCTLKNKGKYEIAYNFLLEYPDSKSQEIVSLFSVVPSSGKLSPQDRPTQVQVIFKSSREVQIKDIPLLKCQVIEPSLSPPRGEVIASIPVKVSVKAVFSKFQITPVSDINFGALLINSKKTRTFVIENKGEFDFRFTITKKEREVNAQGTARQNRPLVKGDKKGRDDTSSTPSAKPKKTESVRQDPSQSKLQLGMFTIFPAFGIILPNGNQVITVDCVGETPGREVQEISIEVTDREPGSQKGGIPYKLVAETCIPAINVDDIGNIFEEHRVCKNLSVWQHSNCGNLEVGGVYGEEERKFVFNNVIVGRTAKARFKISNNNKVPCDVVFTLKPVMVKGAPKSLDVFDLDPPRMQIANHSHIYATVSFTPPSMQSFSAIFEAAVEGASANQAKGKSLIFEISGEGNLPRITISKPSIRNKSGQPLLLFKRILLGRSDSLPFELFNDGNLPSKVAIDLLDSDHAFMLKPTNQTRNIIGDINYNEIETRRRAHTASLVVNPNERATFEVIYQPNAPQRSLANLKVTVTDNQYEDYLVQMVGEGYEDDITLDNIGSDLVTIDPENELIASADDSIEGEKSDKTEKMTADSSDKKFRSGDSSSISFLSSYPSEEGDEDIVMMAAKSNLMNFGDCYINESKTLNLTMTNHSKTDCVRFQWPSHPQFKFSPEVGHLHASCTKDISVTFKSKKPEVLNQVPLQCKVTKIVFDKPIEQVCDWDDKIQVVKWVDNLSATPTLTESGSKSTVAPVKTGKKKVIETETEPANTEIPDTSRDLELLVSAIIDFTKCTCDVETIHFKSTPMFQTRVYSLVLKNEGPVSFDYNWLVVMDSFTPMMRRSVTFLSEGDRPESRVDVVETQYIPFSVEPQYGTIAAGCKMNVVVKFAPLDANDYEGRLICSVPFMNKGEQGPVIGVKGRSIMPYCHFELEESDYLARAKNNHENHNQGNAVQGPNVDPTTRVIEFNVCGIGIKCFKEFGIINPTNEPFTFEWICEDDNDPKQPVCFKCAQPVGEIKNGRKCKVGFEFTSYTLEATESFWRFTIPSRAITIPFLLVGYTREPNICLDRSHLNFKTLLVGREARDTVYLTNNEDTYFNFAFVEDSCHSEGYSAHLKVDPMHGHIPPHSSIPVNLSFSPKTEKETNFNLRCVIQHKKSPVTLNVKAEGYSMNSILLCEDSTGNRVELSDRGVNQINFGEVEVSENIIRHLFLLNTGKFNFDYSCDFHEKTLGTDAVTVTPPRGGVMFGETQEISLAFCPPRKMSLKCCELALKVTNGPTYELCITGQGVVPGILFSFRSHNFGNCFVYKAGLELPKEQAILKLTNKDKKEVSVDCLYSPTSHLSHKFETCVIAPGKTLKVPFTFCPTQPIKYHETVVFEINGLNKQKVEFYGTGHEMKIEVLDPKQKCLNLGARMVGDNVRKFIPIVNNSPSPITFNLALTPTEPALQQKEVLSITPKEQITLDANGGTMKVEVWFRPKARIPQFAEEVLMECSGMSQPIFVVKGSCLGMEVNLDSDYLAFGTVYQRSSSTRKLVMTNSGDMNTKFRWDIKRFKPDFSISPVEGYITPGMEVTFDVVFQPQSVNGDVRYDKLKCYLDGGPHKPITLTLTGSCTGIPPVKEVQNFQCVVRQTETRQLMIPNKSNQLWNLKPIIDGEHWTGPVSFIVEPQQTKSYELTYKPLTMTAENKKHTGSIFFPLPDGSGLLFNLTGVAEPPKVTARIQRDIPCKTGYTELITVSNWLKKPQRFRVKIEPIKPEKLDAGITVKGVEYVDVPANGKKDYKLYFYAYKEGQTILKVTFINEQTGEYQFYEVTFRATKPGTISTINLSTPVRQSIQYTITVDNPLNTQVIFLISCTVPEILVPNMLAVPAGSQGLFTFEYQPLKIGETTGRLELNCTELGQYMYDLVLNATPGVPEKPIYFKTGLGSSVVQVAKFLNFAKQKTDYTCKIDNTDFHVEKTVAAAPGSPGGTEVALEVVFEPSKLGEQRASLMVSSAVGGEYIFPLFGTCTAPKPQGPFIIKTGTTIPIIFRNVFSTATPFTFQVDNPLFHLTKHGETIRPHKDHRIVVGYDGQDSNSKNPVMGKLVVSCARAAGGNSNAQWIFYLKGIPY